MKIRDEKTILETPSICHVNRFYNKSCSVEDRIRGDTKPDIRCTAFTNLFFLSKQICAYRCFIFSTSRKILVNHRIIE